jgi:hypothetical protein
MDIDATAVPAQQNTNREGVPKIVHTRQSAVSPIALR